MPDEALTLICADEAATDRLAETLAMSVKSGDLILLDGDLGAGKTHLARALVRALAADPVLEVPSPTFTLAQAYTGLPCGTVTHYDLYRLDTPEELEDLALNDALLEGVALVEWPQRGALRAEQASLAISIGIGEDDARQFMITGKPGPLQRLHRSLAIRKFLNEQNMAGGSREHLTGDASARSYETIRRADGSDIILMNAPASPDGPKLANGKPYSATARLAENMRAFEGVDRLLRDAGFRVPEIYASDLDAGLLLIEDLGTGSVLDDDGNPIRERYCAAVACLAAMHSKAWPDRVALSDGGTHIVPPYDTDAILIEVDLLAQWYAPDVLGQPLGPVEGQSFVKLWQGLAEDMQGTERTLVLRDFHSPNIIWTGSV